MSLLTQKTLAGELSFSGIGIHSGEKVNMRIIPGLPNEGIIFKRVDIKKNKKKKL